MAVNPPLTQHEMPLQPPYAEESQAPPSQAPWYPPGPGEPPAPPPPAPAASSPNRMPRRWPTVLASGVAAAAVALGVSVVTDDDPTGSNGVNQTPVVSPSETDDGETSGSPTTADTTDPVAAAAAAIAPAVVQIETGSGLGSGVIYSEDGLILTAAHVVGNGDEVRVRLSDGTTVDGTVLGADGDTDVAMVQIDGGTLPAVATLATGVELVVGQLAVAVGSPFGLDQTVTSGIVSATNRDMNGIATVQTDAAINPGNSGGPLVDSQGRVIGINDSIISESGGNDGLGFAIAIDLAVNVADQIVAGDEVSLAQLGVGTTEPADGQAGALVQEVVPGSGADEAGVEVGDVIVAVDGEPIIDGSQLRARILAMDPGDEIEVLVERDGEQQTLTATLGSTSD
jgi:putative serine protease PepD